MPGATLALGQGRASGVVAGQARNGTARLWDLRRQSGQELPQLVGHDGPVRAVAVSSDAAYILTGGEDQTVRMFYRFCDVADARFGF